MWPRCFSLSWYAHRLPFPDPVLTHLVFQGGFGVLSAVAVMFGQWTAPCPVPEHTAREHCYMYFIWAILQIHVPAGVGTFGFGVCVFWQAIASSLRRAMGDNKSGSDAAVHVVFASMRFTNGQPLPEALQLRDALRERGVHLKIVELTAGADINEEVFESIEHAEAFLVFGTSNYGEKTPNPACEPPPACPAKLSLNGVAFCAWADAPTTSPSTRATPGRR